MQRWCGLFVLLATTFAAPQNANKTTATTGNTRFGPGGQPFGGGFGNPGVPGGGFGNPGFPQGGFGNPGFPQGGFGNPGFPQGVSPPIGPGIIGPGIGGPGINPQQPFISPLRPDCKFFKRDQFGRWVCDVDQKPFECPPLRPECPRFGSFAPAPPQQCFNDNDCYNNDKCCPDICFDHLICKGPE